MKLELIGTPAECSGLHREHFATGKDAQGMPVNGTVQFVDGLAECSDELGTVLVDLKRAKASGLQAEDAKATIAAAKAAEKAAADAAAAK
jgi:hypothetical protein